MASLKDLVEPDCGESNPLMKLVTKFTQDPIHQEVRGAEASLPPDVRDPCGFNMADLLNEMHDINSQMAASSLQGMGGSMLSADPWASEFMSGQQLDEPQLSDATFSFNSRPMHGSSDVPAWVSEEQTNDMLSTSGMDALSSLNFLTATSQSLECTSAEPDWASDYLSKADYSALRPEGGDCYGLFNQPGYDNPYAASPLVDSSLLSPKLSLTLDDERIISENWAMASGEKSSLLEANVWGASPQSTFSPVEETNTPQDTSATDIIDDNNTKQESTEQDGEFWSRLQREWEQLARDDNDGENPWMADFEAHADPYKQYNFDPDNKLIEHLDPFREGLERLQMGDLPSAVLLFEASVQKDPEHAEGWQYLGATHAQNEQDAAAIAALRRCLELDPSNLTALMALAVCYTNESLQAQACFTLRDWLKHNPRYRHLCNNIGDEQGSAPKPGVSSILDAKTFKSVLSQYLLAARLQPDEPDSDIQCGLGVLFNLSGDHEKGVDCFRSALSVKPDDAALWNRLGATLANSGKSEEAIVAYQRALTVSPGFVRCRYNLGISCINLKAYKEAAEHFLTALTMQEESSKVLAQTKLETGSRPSATLAMSENIWTTLRLALSLLDRPDLCDYADARNLDKLNEHFKVTVEPADVEAVAAVVETE